MATAFSAITARERFSDIIQFQTSNGTGIVTLVNGKEIDFNVVVEQEFNDVTVINLGNNKMTATFASGVYLEVQEENDILSSLVVSLPESYKTVGTQGLLGTFNGDASDDLKPKSQGESLPVNSSLQEIHESFGLTCK